MPSKLRLTGIKPAEMNIKCILLQYIADALPVVEYYGKRVPGKITFLTHFVKEPAGLMGISRLIVLSRHHMAIHRPTTVRV
jgi:hypothetical protein